MAFRPRARSSVHATMSSPLLLSSLRRASPFTRSATRSLASASYSGPYNPNTVGPFQVFDRNAKRLQKDRAARRDGGARSRTVDYVRDEVADRLIERVLVRLFCAPDGKDWES